VATRRGRTVVLEELKIHPGFKAAFNLSRLYEALGDRQLQIDALKQAIDGNPHFAEGHIFLAKRTGRRPRLRPPSTWRGRGSNCGRALTSSPWGTSVLADLYNRTGRSSEAAREVARGRAAEGRPLAFVARTSSAPATRPV
jgi:hypothetical protein